MKTIYNQSLELLNNNIIILIMLRRKDRRPEIVNKRLDLCIQLKELGFSYRELGKFFNTDFSSLRKSIISLIDYMKFQDERKQIAKV